MANLVIGSRGLLGSAVSRAIPSFGPTREQLDLDNPLSIEEYFEEFKPEVVINCGAISNVDLSETDEEAFSVNGSSLYYLAKASKKNNSILVHVSTDYVFPDCQNEGGWKEETLPEPDSTYGKIKLAGESLALINPKTYVLRVSSLYGPDRSCHARWILNAKPGEKVNICEDMVGSPTYTEDLAEWIKKLISSKAPYGIYHAVPTGFVSRYGFAEKMINLLGSDLSVLNRIKINDLGLPSKRPRKPILNNEKWQREVGSLPKWEESLERYIKSLKVAVNG